MKLIVLLSLFVLSAVAEKARFDNYRVYRVFPVNKNQINSLRSLESNEAYDFWTEARSIREPVDVMVAPHKIPEFNEIVKENNLRYKIVNFNVQSLVDGETSTLKRRAFGMEWTNYHNLEEIYAWLDDLARKYPKIVKVVVGGKSYEGRPIKGIEINYGNNLTTVVIEAGIHAREWISPAGTTWMINEMLTGSVDPVFKKFNYLYFPVYNPDGYTFTWSTNRMWRKTRTPYKSSGRPCYGADPNRNWDFHWNEIGSSNDPCSETYAGPKAFSEVETKSMAEYLLQVSKKKKLDIVISYHSYSQLLMYPWGYTEAPSKNDKIFKSVATAAVKDLTAVHGTKFDIGSIATTIYPTSGTSIEWYFAKFNSTLAFVYEMRDTGKYGFVLPPRYIVPCGEEHLASFRRILLEYLNLKK